MQQRSVGVQTLSFDLFLTSGPGGYRGFVPECRTRIVRGVLTNSDLDPFTPQKLLSCSTSEAVPTLAVKKRMLEFTTNSSVLEIPLNMNRTLFCAMYLIPVPCHQDQHVHSEDHWYWLPEKRTVHLCSPKTFTKNAYQPSCTRGLSPSTPTTSRLEIPWRPHVKLVKLFQHHSHIVGCWLLDMFMITLFGFTVRWLVGRLAGSVFATIDHTSASNYS